MVCDSVSLGFNILEKRVTTVVRVGGDEAGRVNTCHRWFYPMKLVCINSELSVFRAVQQATVYIQGVPGGMCQTSGECSLR